MNQSLKRHCHDFCLIWFFYCYCLQCLKIHLKWSIKIWVLVVYLHKQHIELTVLYNVNNARTLYLFTLVQYTKKSSFTSWFLLSVNLFKVSIYIFLRVYIIQLSFKLGFSVRSSKCKQKHGLRFVYITGNSELYIMLLTRRLTLKFLITRRTVSLKHCKYQKRKHYLFFD